MALGRTKTLMHLFIYVTVALSFLSCSLHAFTTSTQWKATTISPQTYSSFTKNSILSQPRSRKLRCKYKSRAERTGLKMLLGQDSSVFGVGAPEVATILLVGYFVLGPTDLYKLVKEGGKLLNSVRTLSSEYTRNFEESMESTIELEELKKAQRELNDAFSFRRSINVDESDDPFTNKRVEKTIEPNSGVVNETSSPKDIVKSLKKKRRRKKKMIENVEEVDTTLNEATRGISDIYDDIEIDNDANESLNLRAPINIGGVDNQENNMGGGTVYKNDYEFTGDSVIQKEVQERDAFEESRFASQLSGSWNDQILANEEKLNGINGVDEQIEEDKNKTNDDLLVGSALGKETGERDELENSKFGSQLSSSWNDQILENENKWNAYANIMERLDILEAEKVAAGKRLEEEFRQKAELEEKFYAKKRKLLEDAAAEMQTSVNFENDDETFKEEKVRERKAQKAE